MSVPTLTTRISGSFGAVMRTARSSPILAPVSLLEEWRLRVGGHPADERHLPHLVEAVDWLARAQDATPDDGFARGYSLTWNVYFAGQGWQPSYPETTGYIIPTLYAASRFLARPELAERATRAARWESRIQLESGAVQGGVVGQPVSPSVFNTGQVLFGWLAAWRETGDGAFAESARRAGRFLADALEPDGHWRRGNSKFARAGSTLYNARVAWALAEAGVALQEPDFVDAAARNLRAVVALQHANGWFPDCCLTDPARPLLHTIAYTVRGLLEGGRVLEDEALVRSAALASEALAARVGATGWMAGRYAEDWRDAVRWSCLTGEAQMANNWMRLAEITGERRWLEPVPRVLGFLKSTQNRTAGDPGLRGGIKGSAPVSGGYGSYEILNWATKYFADALMRDERQRTGAGPVSATHFLA
jgi:uncharacterized protein YyaL (SSP411 family)